MQVLNNTVSFVNADFSALTPHTVAALVAFIGPTGVAPKDYAANLLNSQIDLALRQFGQNQASELELASKPLSIAQQDQIKGFLNQARSVAGLSPIP